MAEFKIIGVTHRLDELKPAEVSALAVKDLKFLDRYNRRYQLGDILSVREDGRYGNRTHPNFIIVKVPGMSVKDGENYIIANKRFYTELEKNKFAQRYVDNEPNFTGDAVKVKADYKMRKLVNSELGMKTLMKSRYKLDVSRLPTLIGNVVTITEQQFFNVLVDKA